MITNLPYDNLNYILYYLDSKSAFKMFMTCTWFYFNFNDYIVSNHKNPEFIVFYDIVYKTIFYNTKRYIFGRDTKKIQECLEYFPIDYHKNCQMILFDNINRIDSIKFTNLGFQYNDTVSDTLVKMVLPESNKFKRTITELNSDLEDFISKSKYPKLEKKHRDFSYLIWSKNNNRDDNIFLTNVTEIIDDEHNIFLANTIDDIIQISINILSKGTWWSKFITRDKTEMSIDYYMRFILKEANPKQKLLFNSLLIVKVPHYHIIHHARSNRRMRNFISTYRNRENYIKFRSVNAINPDNYHETVITSIPLIKFMENHSIFKVFD